MEHKGTKRIETERLTLRPFRVEDAEAMYHNWASDEMEILLDLETKKTVRLKKLIPDWRGYSRFEQAERNERS